jgi:hypothetical protein
LICTACGWLELPADMTWNARDPHRHEGGVDRESAPCPHCGRREWADLGDAATIATLRHVDLTEAPTRASTGMRTLRRAWAVTRGVSGLAIGAALVTALLGSPLASDMLLIMMYPGLVALGIVVFATVIDAVREVRDARAAPLPARWRLALPSARTPIAAASGPVQAIGPLLRGPLTGRPCIAYELGIRTDDDAGAPDSTWLLLEQRSTAFAVGKERYAADAVRLDLVRTKVEPTALSEDRLGAIVRARGFLTSDTTLALFEAIVPDDARIEVQPTQMRTGPSGRAAELARVRLLPAQPVLPAAVGERA